MRQVRWSEGDCGVTEPLIQQLFKTPPEPTASPTEVTTANRDHSPEMYMGYTWGQSAINVPTAHDGPMEYESPDIARDNHFSCDGEWAVGAVAATAGPDACMVEYFYASDALIVLGGTRTITAEVQVDTSTRTTIDVSGAPDLYAVWSGMTQDVLLNLTFSAGVQAYTFTFG